MNENKRYSDGTLAKWYYSQTNVISDGDNEYYLRNKESVKDLNYNELLGTNDLLDELNKLSDENEQLKQVLGGILIEVKQQISTSHTGEIRAFINPNSFDLISEVLRKYGALKEWYDD